MPTLNGVIELVLKRVRGRAGRPVRFVMAGALNTALGLALYPALLLLFEPLRTHYLMALGIAQAVCLVFAFFTYKLGVFRTQGNGPTEFFRFASFYLVNYAANWAALPILVEFGKIDPVYAQLAFTAVIVIGSYFWHSRITFGDAHNHD